jgi:adenylate cyclase
MEIERKFLVNKSIWKDLEKPVPSKIQQAYLYSSTEKTIRVRTKGDKGFLTIKGATKGISRQEFEYEIPIQEAEEMIKLFAEKLIIKQRYEIIVSNHLWEIDEFHGKLEGLILAEVELKDENEVFEIPVWVVEEVSHDPQYYNSNLIEKC